MSNIQTEITGFWNSFHNWVTKNPGFYLGAAVGAGACWIILKLL
jgi:hypothetical protein